MPDNSTHLQALFDLPSEYDEMLRKGIGVTGNDKYFFINGRLDRVEANLETKPSTILDFGCGIGDSSIELERRFPGSKITGSDLSDAALDFARQKFADSKIDFVSLSNLNGSQKFDLIYLNCVIHHVPVSVREKVIHQLFNLMEPGGSVFIFENNPANPGTQLAMYTNPFDKDVVKVWPNQLKEMLKKSGFEIRKSEFIFYFPQWLSFFRPIEKWLIRLPLGGQYGILARKPLHLQP